MSLDASLKAANALVRHRNVLTRDERLAKLKEDEKWQEGRSVFGLPKVAHRKQTLAKAAKEEAPAEGAAGTAAAGTTAAGAAPAAATAPAKGAAMPAKGATPAKPGAATTAAAAPAKGKK